MTQEQKSIETTIIKISVRQAWLIGVSLVFGAFWSTMLYNDIMNGQKDILNAINSRTIEVDYELDNIKKDVIEFNKWREKTTNLITKK